MSRDVFTYGSLMFPDVWGLVVAGRYAQRVATLAGHARHAVRDETYPGMVVRAGRSVTGVLYLGVDDGDLDRLDRFEGDDYERATVDVVDADGVAHRAETYVYRRLERLLDAAWDPDAFEKARFIATYCKDRLDPTGDR